jgi:hypothetical protein
VSIEHASLIGPPEDLDLRVKALYVLAESFMREDIL